MDLRLAVLRVEAKKYRKSDPRIFLRFLALIELVKRQASRSEVLSLSELDYELVAIEFEISGRTLRRWKKRYEKNGAKGLGATVCIGKKANAIRGWTAKQIIEWREDYKWGAEVIAAHLWHDHGIKLGRFRIERFLKRKGFIKQVRSYQKKQKHKTVVRVTTPGAHTQVDVKYQTKLLRNKTKCYVYNFVDHASRWEFKRAYDSYGPHETKLFMQGVIAHAPFKLLRLQSDNGVEFTNKYLSKIDGSAPHALDTLCLEMGIRHVLIPPGEKELQGLVERSHRTDDEELYHRIKPRDVEEFNELLKAHCEWRNNKRRRGPLNWKTPMEFLKEYEKQKLAMQEQQKLTEKESTQELKKAA